MAVGAAVSERAWRRLDVHAARRLVAIVAQLRGISVKALQLLAIERDLFTEQAALELERACFALPPLTRARVRVRLAEELGHNWRTILPDIELQPFAAASIGQVYRGRLADGTDVAIKLQYPGIRERIDRDLRVLRTVLQFSGERGYYATVLDELRDRLRDECDYRLEAENLAFFAGHTAVDGAAIPTVYPHASSDAVLTCSLARGEHVTGWLQTDPSLDARDQAAQRIQDFHVRGLYHHGRLHADANPGNFLFAADGAVTVLDFGSTRRLSQAEAAAIARTLELLGRGERPSLADYRAVGMFVGLPDARAMEIEGEFVRPFREWLHASIGPDRFDFARHPDHAATGRARFLHLCRGGGHLGMHPAVLLVGRTMFGLYRIYQRLGARVRLKIATELPRSGDVDRVTAATSAAADVALPVEPGDG